MNTFRSLLFVPGSHAARVEKALNSAADVAILDLEDAVAVSEKAASRPLVVAALARSRERKTLGYVRVNALSTEWAFDDLAAMAAPGVDGVVLPKVESAADLAIAHWALENAERAAGLPIGGLDIIPIIETAAGLSNIDAIARFGGRVKRLSFGAGDFTLDLDIEWSAHETELLPARFDIVRACRNAGIEPPIDSVWVRLKDHQGLAASAQTARGLGFQGKLCIHPDQLMPVNTAFSPSPTAIENAHAVLNAFKAAEAEGLASIQLDGQFIDYPIVYRAQRVVALAARIQSQDR